MNYQKLCHEYIIPQKVPGRVFQLYSKLASAAKVSEEEARKWLEKQALWQIYLPAPKYIPRPHWEVSKPNMIHQADLLFFTT